ncbi:hypothetical protein CASFOL_027550 [Castilleja foliolosa]|uniref:Glycosyltransferase n=1 Tax=Castilleja foliolosa TaxID=1961234 RepID=A0ABD3CGU9_9LAMI
MANNNKNQKPHAIMISLHLQGHIIPFVNLAIKLASKGFTITFAHLDYIHHQISKSHHNTTEIDIFARARESGLDIHYTTINDGLPVDFDRAANFNLHLENFQHQFPDKVDELVSKIITQPDSNSDYFLIADTFCLWSERIAKKYNLVNVSFWTEPALVFSLYYHLDLLRENGHVPVTGREENVDYIPGISSINTKDFVSYFQDTELTLLHKILFRAFDLVKSADFVICNTIQELELEAISALQQKQPFYAIGPVLPSSFSENTVARSFLPELNTVDWLNSKNPGSVLYVSFGSLAKTDKNVISEIAGGLLLSGVNFLWVLRPGMTNHKGGNLLPDGFEDSVRDRGLIVPWCDQNKVLSNSAIGGFLTHCGWNSILESIWCGVPMICYPLFTDQMTNRRLVVDDWRIGMNLCDGEVITRNEVAEKIGILMSGKRSDELKMEIGNTRKIVQSALMNGGSSEKNFDCFVEDVCDEIRKRNETV